MKYNMFDKNITNKVVLKYHDSIQIKHMNQLTKKNVFHFSNEYTIKLKE